ncbi:DUF881 domain-containing protein [Sulfobacillus harzensis]|uniref:DUF881 domain-containing protein n=1 Tax=Sulfobacillus harzensis TaxID=2729629 RepID=A0A7Y0Q1M7_9FIRM|nr:DUF881 domain-containing protein [Sulfobacillus harzensis]NMP21617.1 DUF881 domain-containing protein [Sulfobacillus harzensis]
MAQRLVALLAAIAAVAGFLITQQIRTVSALNRTAAIQQGKTLEYLVTKADQFNVVQEHRISRLAERLKAEPPAPSLGPIEARLSSTGPLAALTPVSGAGVTVLMHDATHAAFPGEPNMLRLVHDQYVLRVIALMSAAGARAISIDGQRFTAITSIFCAGPTIRINGIPYASPYRIEAVGPRAAMLKALNSDPDIQGWAQLVSIKYHPESHLEIAPYRGPVQFSLAKPVKIGE